MRHARRLVARGLAAAAALVLTPALPADDAGPARPPNVVIIFVDDVGYGDLGAFGADGWTTPHLDRMAADGARFTSFYAAQPVCTASRAALLTGCYPNRLGLTGAIGPNATHGLHPDETTVAELCRAHGYRTAAYGKWHLGHRPPFLPPNQGFEDYLGIPYSNDMWPHHPAYADLPPDAAQRKQGYPDLPMYEGDAIVDAEITGAEQAAFTKRFTERAVAFIERHRDEPFFVYLAHPMAHVPLFTSPSFTGRSRQGAYGDVMAELDWSVGRVLRAVRDAGVDDRTLVLFTSDNGPWLSYGNHAGTTGPLREGKGSTWEGGVRVPFIARWPGRIPPGLVCDEPVMAIDILPTIAALIGAELPPRGVDGRDIWPLLSGAPGATSPHDALYFYYHANDLEALRSGRWKLVFPHRFRSLTGEPGRDGRPAGYTHPSCGLELYDLAADIGETRDLASRHPDVVARLTALAERARADLGDALTDREGTGRREPGRWTPDGEAR